MRTFHTGEVFSGDLRKQIRATSQGTLFYDLDRKVPLFDFGIAKTNPNKSNLEEELDLVEELEQQINIANLEVSDDINDMTFTVDGDEEVFAMGEEVNLGDGSGDLEETY